jgi:hypothetical protein
MHRALHLGVQKALGCGVGLRRPGGRQGRGGDGARGRACC